MRSCLDPACITEIMYIFPQILHQKGVIVNLREGDNTREAIFSNVAQ